MSGHLAVIGLGPSDARYLTPEAGEALVLFVVPDEGARVVAEEVRRHLPAHWALDSVHLVSELPKTSRGKIELSALSV